MRFLARTATAALQSRPNCLMMDDSPTSPAFTLPSHNSLPPNNHHCELSSLPDNDPFSSPFQDSNDIPGESPPSPSLSSSSPSFVSSRNSADSVVCALRHRCELCDLSFAYPSQLARHRRRNHNTEISYLCGRFVNVR